MSYKENVRFLVRQLVDPETGLDLQDKTMRKLQAFLRVGTVEAMRGLQRVVRDKHRPTEARALALETLAAARSQHFESRVTCLVTEALAAPEIELRWSAVVCFSDLLPKVRETYHALIKSLASDDPSPEVRRLARAFLDLEDQLGNQGARHE